MATVSMNCRVSGFDSQFPVIKVYRFLLHWKTLSLFGFSQVSSAGSSYPGMKEELYEAVRRVLLCLDSLTDLLLTPGDTGEDEPQLKLLQQEVAQHIATSTNSIKYCSEVWYHLEISLFSMTTYMISSVQT